MNIVEEPGVVVSLDGNIASIAPVTQSGCQSCASSGSCGTSFLAPLFTNKQRLLVAENTINARPGDEIIIGLNRTALVSASLMVYLLPLVVLVLAAAAGEAIAQSYGLENGEVIAILSGLGSALLTFIFVSRVIRSALFSAFFKPFLIDRR
ncbi:MAG: SoxR reducing system RseC family protein [Gammaproteobacteria bacterium]|nr:SoxR reducing system RseC family protein [Gammaproteobacteria bacterium]